MKFLSFLPKSRNRGFTMIELLIVIAILGILAVAVLSAINPIEQINRGRDTGNRSDAEQLLSAIDRYTAFVGYYPWQHEVSPTTLAVAWTDISTTALMDGGTTNCNVLDKLSGGDDNTPQTCEGTDELKESFVDRILETDYNDLWIYNQGQVGNSTYVCFLPQSNAFRKEAADRCVSVAGEGLPTDLLPVAATVCATGSEMICLP